MERVLRYAQQALGRACIGLGIVAAVIGCHHACKSGQCEGGHCGGGSAWCIDNCSDIPQGAIPQPIGTFTNQWINKQAGKAELDDFTIYYNEWVDGQVVLGPYGSDHLSRIINRLPTVPFIVLMQPEPERPILNGLRHQALIQALFDAGIRDAERRVVVGQSPAEYMYGERAPQVYNQLLQGGGGFGGGGFQGFGGGFAGFGGVGFGGGFGFR